MKKTMILFLTMICLTGCGTQEEEKQVLDPNDFTSEIASIDQKVNAFNQEIEKQVIEEDQRFIFKELVLVEGEYEMRYHRKDGVNACFVFDGNERLARIELFVSKKKGEEIREKGTDVASMLMETIFHDVMDQKNQYNFMLLCRDFNESIRVEMDDENLKKIIVVKDKEKFTITITLSKQRDVEI